MTRIFSISSVSVLVTRWCRPRHALSTCWKRSLCRIDVDLIRRACWSISAMIALIVPTTSSETTAVSRSACSASVRTARSTSAARAVGLRLELLLQERGKSVRIRGERGVCGLLGFGHDRSLPVFGRELVSPSSAWLRRGDFSSAGSLSTFADQLFGAGLAVHVGDEVRKLGARFQQLVERVDLAGDGGRREVVHALEGDVDAAGCLRR